MIQRLFVYGTLAPGRANQDVLSTIPGYWESATVTGKLVNAGWAANTGYPAIVLDGTGQTISGFIFNSDRLNDQWARIDEFEGSDYQRVQTTVCRSDGVLVEAHIYTLRTAGSA